MLTEKSWKEDEQLSYLAFGSLEELQDHLKLCHKEMMQGQHGCLGYLYRQQTLRVNQLKRELENVRKRHTN